ncbi:MAG: M48 family metalloprotease [Candidatus Hodarchaeales archaeon]
MKVIQGDNKGVRLPLMDILLITMLFIIYPLVLGMILIIVGILNTNNLIFYIELFAISFVLFMISALIYYRSYNELRSYAVKVSFPQFFPSWRDLILVIINQVYYIVFLGIILRVFLISAINQYLDSWFYFSFSIIISLAFQFVIVLLSMNSKRKLLATAQETVPTEIIENIKNLHPQIYRINDFRFADIDVASLFLTAGVMKLGLGNICLISRYFQWKLTDEEIIAVISHEEGHIANNHIFKIYLINGTEAFLRSLRIFCILTAFTIFFNIDGISLPLYMMDPFFFLVFFFLVVFVFLSSAFLRLVKQYRILLQEIRVDRYGAKIVGSDILASTLKKLPSTIPAPLFPRQTDFLKFRIALLLKMD